MAQGTRTSLLASSCWPPPLPLPTRNPKRVIPLPQQRLAAGLQQWPQLGQGGRARGAKRQMRAAGEGHRPLLTIAGGTLPSLPAWCSSTPPIRTISAVQDIAPAPDRPHPRTCGRGSFTYLPDMGCSLTCHQPTLSPQASPYLFLSAAAVNAPTWCCRSNHAHDQGSACRCLGWAPRASEPAPGAAGPH